MRTLTQVEAVKEFQGTIRGFYIAWLVSFGVALYCWLGSSKNLELVHYILFITLSVLAILLSFAFGVKGRFYISGWIVRVDKYSDEPLVSYKIWTTLGFGFLALIAPLVIIEGFSLVGILSLIPVIVSIFFLYLSVQSIKFIGSPDSVIEIWHG